MPIKWTAPEILSGNVAELSSKSDVYVQCNFHCHATINLIFYQNENNQTYNDFFRAFSYDVTAAILMFQNNETAAIYAYWCTKSFLRELNSISMYTSSFVSVSQYGRWPRE